MSGLMVGLAVLGLALYGPSCAGDNNATSGQAPDKPPSEPVTRPPVMLSDRPLVEGDLSGLLEILRNRRRSREAKPALVKMGAAALPGLRDVVATPGYEVPRRVAFDAIMEIGAAGHDIVPVLRALVSSEDVTFFPRLWATRYLVKKGEKDIHVLVEPFIQAAPLAGGGNSESALTRELQMYWLNSKLRGLDEEARLKALQEMLHTARYRPIVTEALIELGPLAFEPMRQLLLDRNGDFSCRLAATRVLNKVAPGPASTPALIEVLEDPTESNHLRSVAAALLGAWGDRSAIPALERTINTWAESPMTETYNVRRIAQKALDELRTRTRTAE